MTKKRLPVRFTGQHFTIDVALIKYAIELSEIQSCDIVFDLGGGKGYIADELLKKAYKVIVLENDGTLAEYLQNKYSRKFGVVVHFINILDYSFPKTDFKVVSNIPYGITSQILKKLMHANVSSFQGGCIILQLEAARKVTSKKNYNPYTVFYNTFYDITLVKRVNRDSFNPPPTITSALLRINKRKDAIVPVELSSEYLRFLFFMLKQPELKVLTVLKKIFQKKQLRFMVEKYAIDLDKQVIFMPINQWARCFMEMKRVVPLQKR